LKEDLLRKYAKEVAEVEGFREKSHIEGIERIA